MVISRLLSYLARFQLFFEVFDEKDLEGKVLENGPLPTVTVNAAVPSPLDALPTSIELSGTSTPSVQYFSYVKNEYIPDEEKVNVYSFTFKDDFPVSETHCTNLPFGNNFEHFKHPSEFFNP